MNITTVEGIGSSRTGFHPIQERLADNNGSQCGYCSPGMVMQMYSLLENNSNPSRQDVEDHFDGNICRCTGYRPILDAMKSFCPEGEETQKTCSSRDSCKNKDNHTLNEDGSKSHCCINHAFPDIEELVAPKYPKYQPPQHMAKPVNAPPPHPSSSSSSSITSYASVSASTPIVWVTCTSLPSLATTLAKYSAPEYIVKLVVGNTSVGIYKDDNPNVLIDIHSIPELKATSNTAASVTVGSAVTLSDLITKVTGWASSLPNASSYTYLATHLTKVANIQVRNVASWAGNIMLVNLHDDFPSDVCTCLMTFGATLTIMKSSGSTFTVSMTDFLQTDMRGCAILSMTIPLTQQNEQVRTFKVALRHENSHAYINCGLRAVLDSSMKVTSQPTLVYGGLAAKTVRMAQTEKYLIGQQINSVGVLQGALTILKQEALSVLSAVPGKTGYRLSLVASFFYKALLGMLPSGTITPNLLSAAQPYIRPESSGIQSFTTQPSESPVSMPVPKLKSRIQASGELKYATDVAQPAATLHGAIVQSTVACGALVSINPSAALSAPGVVAFFSAKDIPGQNNWGEPIVGQEIFASTTISYFGQAVGMVVADTFRHALDASQLVKVTYNTDGLSPILTISDAITANSFHPESPLMPTGAPIVSGNVDSGFAQSDKLVAGQLYVGGQQHFHMEQHITIATPTESGGLSLRAATQSLATTQQVVASALNMPENLISVETGNIGGSFGSKISSSIPASCAASLAAMSLNVPVRVETTLNQSLELYGKRNPMMVQYQVGVMNDGTLKAMHVVVYTDYGYWYDASPGTVNTFVTTIDNCYYLPNMRVDALACKTNLPANTSMRGPGWVTAVFAMENIMDHVATQLAMNPDTFRQMNFYANGQYTPYGQPIANFNIPRMWSAVQTSSDYKDRLAVVQAYNTANRFTKRGVAISPVKFGIGWGGAQYGVLLNVMPDGTVNISHSGIEIGQGINTKVAQVCAFELGIPLSSVQVLSSSTLTVPNASTTGGSITSCVNSMAMINAAQILNARLAPVKQSIINQNGPNAPPPTWQQIITAAIQQGVDLQAKGWEVPSPPPAGIYNYFSYVTAISEVMIDVLTGEVQILRSDILFDAGISLNPAIDIGQVEGAFVQGCGYYLTEEILYDVTSSNPGALVSNGTWEYKPPSSKDIPIDFRVTLLADSPNPVGVLGAKGSGEPPLAAACTAFLAVKRAIQAARSDIGLQGYFQMDSPATVENIQTKCMPQTSSFPF
eukprot:TRINITY_DN4821_c0_g1_i1.p1 TRINITY_DN4821_c0_g1~~TRINITY_DN4821_c0_g1_i1.p1  ORF type:complete len:1340 (+),score=354.41 TRINITY_DN4821_c0_g1_i1:272-4021(+)